MYLCFLKRFSLTIFAIFSISSFALAQSITLRSPVAGGATVASAPDYATEVLKNPWDFDSSDDLANFISSADIGAGLSNVSVTNGQLVFDVTTGNDAYFHMLSPGQCNSNALGKNGQALPIDTSKYRYLVFRMYNSAVDDLYVLWYTGCNYADKYRRTGAIQTKPGWHVYVVDLENPASGYATNAGETRNWSQVGSVTGLRIDPGGVGATASAPLRKNIDWMMLAGTPPSNKDHNLDYSVSGASGYFNLFIDDNQNPLDGVQSWLKQQSAVSGGASSVTIGGNYLFPGKYYVGGFVSDDWATTKLGDPWDFVSSHGESPHDITQTEHLNNLSVANGDLSATTANTLSMIHLNMHDETANGNEFQNLCFEMTLSGASGSRGTIWWQDNGTWNGPIYFNTVDGKNVYSINTAGTPAWTGSSQINKININPVEVAGAGVTLHWAALRSEACNSTAHSVDTAPTIETAPGQLTVNAAPSFDFIQPDAKGGADFAATVLGDPWNMDTTTDIAYVEAITGARFYTDTEEYNRHGDFFCASNEEGNDDPYQVSFSDTKGTGSLIDATRFKNATVQFYVDRPQDVVNGSVLRLIGLNLTRDGGTFSYINGDDTFYGGQSWETITQDMTDWKLEELIHPNPPAKPWDGNMNEFRADIHEFLTSTRFCIDRIELRADHESDTEYTIAYSLSDADSAESDVKVSFFYSTTAGATSGGTAIASDLDLTEDTRLVSFNTSQLANGTYYLYAVISDGENEYTRAAPGRMVVNHSLAQDSTDPVLSLDYPKADADVYQKTGIPVIGYALDNVKLALVEVLIDGTLAAGFGNGQYYKAAHDAHPTYADASNAGFEEFVAVDGTGAYTVTVRACDTAGNCVSKDVEINVVAGADPSPPSLPASTGGSTLPIGDTPLALTTSLDTNGLLNLSVANADVACLGGNVVLVGHMAKRRVIKNKKTVELARFTATAQDSTVVYQSYVPQIKGFKKRNKRTGKTRRIRPIVFLGAYCESKPDAAITPVKLKAARKQVKSPQTPKKKLKWKAWLKYLAENISRQ